jgi:hypothetical protein
MDIITDLNNTLTKLHIYTGYCITVNYHSISLNLNFHSLMTPSIPSQLKAVNLPYRTTRETFLVLLEFGASIFGL